MCYNQDMKKYHVGYVFEHGGVIVDGPMVLVNEKSAKKSYKWKVKCPHCLTEDWKFSNTLVGLKYPCKKCYDNSLKVFDDGPAVKRAFISLKSNAKARNIEVLITETEFRDIASQNCFYCGQEPVEKFGPKEWQTSVYLNGIDRIDNNTGYSIDNICSCCEQCNWAKKDLSLEDFKAWIIKLSQREWVHE